jgi:nitrate reductase gamma subunit
MEELDLMEHWLEWARGPAFRFAFAVMLLGIARVLILNILGIVTLRRQARDKSIPVRIVVRDTLRWFFPFKRLGSSQLHFTVASFVFHVCIILVPVFLGAHILLWERGLGIGWPAISQTWADWLTLAAIVSSLFLFIRRVRARATRALSRTQDYLLPLIIAVPFVSGYLAMHPAFNPFSYNATMFVHVMSGNLIFVLIPFSKLSHVALFPTTQLISELGWHLAPESGRRVALALGKEGEAI